MDTLSQAEVEEQLQQLMDRLDSGTHELAELAVAAARADVEYKRSYAMAYAGTRGPVEERKQSSTLVAIDLYEDKVLKEAVHSSQQELLRGLRAQLDSLRTIAANIRGVS